MRYILISFLFLLVMASCRTSLPSKWINKTAPESFAARFETTQGSFDIEANREWSPAGVDRLYQLIQSGFYTDIAIFRVVPGFVAQFGINNDSTVNNFWREQKIKDEPVIKPNTRGAVSFARGGPQTRTTQLFINLKSNSPRLDTLEYNGVKGFPVVAEVVSGMEVVELFYSGYENEPSSKQDSIYAKGNKYLKENYPRLNYIKRAYIVEEE